MKVIILLVIAIFLVSMLPVDADIMPPGMKGIKRCVKITNLSDFPEVAFVGYIRGPLIKCENPYIITSDECLTQFYKANDLTIYAMEEDYLTAKGLENIDFDSDNNIRDYQLDLNPDWSLVAIVNPLNEEEIFYSVAGFTDDKLVLYESKKISRYVAGIPEKVEMFGKPEVSGLRSTFNNSSSVVNENISDKLEFEDDTDGNIEQVVNSSFSSNQSIAEDNILERFIHFFQRLFGTNPDDHR
ncbi:hypothetical protein [uncultured Methanolobus sp.]|uniref:hypothetical protein n=1 Tax=uncultured Methanolobus sp. TaxID=218300 RepID=UPI0029C98528|nr:hypothetical protein [uncultured Methanolobus sp.]